MRSTKPPPEPPIGDAWYESEEPTRHVAQFELRRIVLRFRARPLPAILVAALITSAIALRVARKPRVYAADAVLALTEGAELDNKGGIPFNQLKEYVWSVLLPDAKLLKLIEDRNLFRLRRTLGPQYGLGELRGELDIEIWKNTFLYYAASEANARKSARISLTITDGDPDLAVTLVRDLASIVIETHDEQRRKLARELARQVKVLRENLEERAAGVTQAMNERQAEIDAATARGEPGRAAALMTDVFALAREAKELDEQLALIARSPEAFADRFTAAGLGTRIDLVAERRPNRQEQSWLVLAMIVVVVGAGSLLGAALFLGAFDSRVHDTDDVARLGLPVLGHVPGFRGDHVGSLLARGARRRRVPFWLRWRSPR